MYETNISFPLRITISYHFNNNELTEAAIPATRPQQSKNIWNESEISPKLLLHIPYSNSTKANDKLSNKNKNKFLDCGSDRINRIHDPSLSVIRNE